MQRPVSYRTGILHSLLVAAPSSCHISRYLFASLGLLRFRSFGYGHSFGVLSHYYGREADLELREDVDTVLQPGMVVSMVILYTN